MVFLNLATELDGQGLRAGCLLLFSVHNNHWSTFLVLHHLDLLLLISRRYYTCQSELGGADVVLGFQVRSLVLVVHIVGFDAEFLSFLKIIV